MIIERIVGVVPCSLNSKIRKTVQFIYCVDIVERFICKVGNQTYFDMYTPYVMKYVNTFYWGNISFFFLQSIN